MATEQDSRNIANVPRWEKAQARLEIRRERNPLSKLLNNALMEGFIKRRVEKFVQGAHVEYLPGTKEVIANAFIQGYTPILACSHDSWANGIPLMRIGNEVFSVINEVDSDTRFQGFLTTLATSFATGDQDIMLGRMYRELKDVYNGYHIYTNVNTRPKDRDEFGNKPNRTTHVQSMIEAVEQGYGLAFFPEGTVAGGRKIKRENLKDRAFHLFDSSVNGMRNFQPIALETTISAVRQAGREALIIPTAIWGDNNVIQPFINKPGGRITYRALLAAGLGILQGEFSHAIVGTPLKADLLEKTLKENWPDISKREALNNTIARTVASLLPPERRGVFRDQV